MPNPEMPTLTTVPEDGNLYGEVESKFNFGSMSQDFILAGCRMCGVAVSGDEESLEKHKQFHVDLAVLVEGIQQ